MDSTAVRMASDKDFQALGLQRRGDITCSAIIRFKCVQLMKKRKGSKRKPSYSVKNT
ncbi:hypothetical protein OS493_016290 [Desmophyllum pertusum]|uniref:Uncharacterized protein n=1 Tax=Desmophyllum pertusum TaxID=174260 RepID=A0A9W9ZQY1_9CNID|nr:hypothetical protein OS493_016290 [Desmophyllum pertusum]